MSGRTARRRVLRVPATGTAPPDPRAERQRLRDMRQGQHRVDPADRPLRRVGRPAADQPGHAGRAAGLFTAGGTLLVLREDVGRHNAVDKVIGWALRGGRLPLASLIGFLRGTSMNVYAGAERIAAWAGAVRPPPS
jgi:FdhD/NarQ family